MELNYIYRKNANIERYLHKLEVFKGVIELLSKLPHVEENLRRRSLLKSSLFSARIEGNRLTLKDIQYLDGKRKLKSIAQLEIYNILKALRFIYSNKSPQKITIPFILKLHKLVMSGISPLTGRFRKEPSAIFNQAGIAVYVTPPPSQIVPLVQKLVQKTNNSKEPGSVQAAISHFIFEKIHPFLDGNGRVGRLLSTAVLKNGGFSFAGLVSLEEYLENNRQLYYDFLQGQKKEITSFVEFFLEGLCFQTEKVIENFQKVKTELPEDRLLPRRHEILLIVRDHNMVSFDFIRRRFNRIPQSTLHYDLKKLIEDGFIKKLGTTRGVYYKTPNSAPGTELL